MPDLNVVLKLDDRASKGIVNAIRKMSGSNVQLIENQNKLKTATIGLSSAFRALGITIGAIQIVRFAKDTVNAAINFESAFAGVRKTVDATEEEFKQLSDSLIKISRDIPVTAVELSRIEELAGQLGVRGVDNLTKFTETISKIAVTTNLTSESASTSFARIANIMQTPISEVDRMGATVVELGNNFATTESEIVDFANRIAGAGKVVGLTESDIFAFGTAFSSVGVQAERGGTAVSKSLIQIGDAVNQGGDDLKEFARIAGLSADEFAKSFRENAGKTFALFIEGLGKSGLEGAKILQDLQLGDQRLVQSFLSVGGASGLLTKAIDSANSAYKENNALNIEAEKRFGTTASKIQLMKNNITALQIEIGNKLLPVFEKLLVLTKKFVDVATFSLPEAQTEINLVNELISDTTSELDRLQKLSQQNPFIIVNGKFIADEIDIVQTRLEGLQRKLLEIQTLSQTPSGSLGSQITQRAIDNLKNLEEGAGKAGEKTETVFNRAGETIKKVFEEGSVENKKFFSEVSNGLAGVAVQVQTFSEYWNSLWRAMAFTIIKEVVQGALQEVVNKLKEIASFKSKGGIFGSILGIVGKILHEGGMIKAHQGMFVKAHNGLAVDEVPIIAQTGEGILSRKGMSALGGENRLNALNQGQSVGGDTYLSINVNYPQVSKDQDVKNLANMLGYEIQRQLRYARG